MDFAFDNFSIIPGYGRPNNGSCLRNLKSLSLGYEWADSLFYFFIFGIYKK
jgi:hypothetical protein